MSLVKTVKVKSSRRKGKLVKSHVRKITKSKSLSRPSDHVVRKADKLYLAYRSTGSSHKVASAKAKEYTDKHLQKQKTRYGNDR